MPEKKEKKEPLDMTTEEMANYLFPKKVVEHLKTVAQGENAPSNGDDKRPEIDNVSTQER